VDAKGAATAAVTLAAGGVAAAAVPEKTPPKAPDKTAEVREEPAGAPKETAVAAKGKVRIRVLPYANFYVDGQQVASQVGLAEVELAAGPHTIRVAHPYFKPHTWTDVVVDPGAEVSLFHSFPTKATGTVKVGWRQGWGEVFLDGKTTGKVTPCELTSIGVGPHVLTLVRDGAPVPGMRREIQVVEDGEVDVQF